MKLKRAKQDKNIVLSKGLLYNCLPFRNSNNLKYHNNQWVTCKGRGEKFRKKLQTSFMDDL